jgi:glycosyltransferase involved in cell wall biosynthesis
MMRIGVDVKAFKNGTTGIARYLRTILDRLQELDRENEYVLFSCAPTDYTIVNLRWKMVITPWKLPGIVWQQKVLPGLLKRHAIDILWAPEQMAPVFASRRIPVITTIYDLAFLRYPKTCVWSNRLIQRYLLPLAIRRSAIVSPISDFVADEVAATYKKALRGRSIVPVCCGGPAWSTPSGYSAKNRQDFLFFAGNLEPRKNLIRLIGALEILRRDHGLSIPLHLAGPAGWKNQSLHAVIDASIIKNDIVFRGYLSEAALKQEYLTCRALIYPSLYEGFGLPVLEALSLDCLVLTSEHTVMQEVAGSCALYFDPENPASIADTIRHISQPEFDRAAILGRSGEVLAKYSWEQAARTLQDAMRGLKAGQVLPVSTQEVRRKEL